MACRSRCPNPRFSLNVPSGLRVQLVPSGSARKDHGTPRIICPPRRVTVAVPSLPVPAPPFPPPAPLTCDSVSGTVVPGIHSHPPLRLRSSSESQVTLIAPGTSGQIVMTSSPLTTDDAAGPAPGIVCAITPTLLRKSRPRNCDLPTANSALR